LALPGQQQPQQLALAQQQQAQPISYSTRYDDLPPALQGELQKIQCVPACAVIWLRLVPLLPWLLQARDQQLQGRH
jgi:hypothetical protein